MILRTSLRLPSVAFAILSTVGLAAGQTYTSCNPLYGTCPADPALGGSLSVDFSKGSSEAFSAVGSVDQISYSSAGAQFQIVGSGNAPTIQSNFYIMFGRVDVTMLAAPGTGIVSSVVLQSDDLDEIDWEWLGGDTTQVQSNYFGKGNTATYDRASFLPVEAPQSVMHTYTIEWTSASITWSIDGNPLRVLAMANADGAGQYYPQTPMVLKIGSWAGGDPSNPAGTIQWAGGYTDYSQGPFNMLVKSINVVDYSTGTSYSYSDNSGSYGSIVSNGGSIGVGISGGSGTPVSNDPPPSPSLTNIPLSGGMPYVISTMTTTFDRGSYTQPTSATDYWAGTGYRVSSASTSLLLSSSSVESSPYSQVTPASPSPSSTTHHPYHPSPRPILTASTTPILLFAPSASLTTPPHKDNTETKTTAHVQTSTDTQEEAATTTQPGSITTSASYVPGSFGSSSTFAPSSFHVVTTSTTSASSPPTASSESTSGVAASSANLSSKVDIFLIWFVYICIAWVSILGILRVI